MEFTDIERFFLDFITSHFLCCCQASRAESFFFFCSSQTIVHIYSRSIQCTFATGMDAFFVRSYPDRNVWCCEAWNVRNTGVIRNTYLTTLHTRTQLFQPFLFRTYSGRIYEKGETNFWPWYLLFLGIILLFRTNSQKSWCTSSCWWC